MSIIKKSLEDWALSSVDYEKSLIIDDFVCQSCVKLENMDIVVELIELIEL